MRTVLRVAITALGLTELYSLLSLAPLLHPRHSAVYHWTGPAGALFLPAFLDLALVWCAAFLLLSAARRTPALWSIVFLLSPWMVAAQWAVLDEAALRRESLAWSYAAFATLLLGAALWRRSLAVPWRWAVDLTSSALFFFGVGGAVLLTQLAWLAWQARGFNQPKPSSVYRPAPPGPRILWIVFDELSYRQVYERRSPGLALPAFDALAAQSTVFTRVVPAGIFTDRVLPVLMSGAPVDSVSSSPAGRLLLHHPNTDRWQPFDSRRTVFQDAHDLGYRTAVAGWYLPYCRLLGPVLDRCVSSYAIGTRSGMSPQFTLSENMVAPFLAIATTAVRSPAFVRLVQPSPREATLHLADYEKLTHAAEDLLNDRSVTFVLLHLPIPHGGGIYNRAAGRLTTGPSTYLDNLSLADRCLSSLRAQLERTGQWDPTTVILMGDHSWRTTPTGKPETAWSTEEEKASRGGVFDDRPAYLVKLANQHAGAAISQPFAAIRTRSLLDALLKEELKTPETLAAWAKGQP